MDSRPFQALPQHGQLLLTAAKDNDPERIRELVCSGIPVMMCNQIGQTALHVACLWGHLEAVQELLSLGAEVDVQNCGGSTPLHFAAMAKSGRGPEVINALLAAGADVELSDQSGRLPWELLRVDDPELRARLGGPNADLFAFCAENNVGALGELLAGGAKATARDKDRNTLLHVACAGGHREAAALLLSQPALKQPAAWQVHNGEGLLPLHVAAAGDHVALVEMLLDAGAGVDERSYSDSEYAAGNWESGGQELVPADKTALHVAVEAGALAAARALLARGADANATDFDGSTPLALAIFADDLDAATLLLEAGADCNGGGKDYCTPLHHAASAGDLPLVDALLARLAHPNIADDGGWTPLLLAARRGKVEVARRLLQAGADVRASNIRGDSALHLAALNGSAAMVDLLLSAGAPRDVVNAAGKKPVDVAAPAVASALT